MKKNQTKTNKKVVLPQNYGIEKLDGKNFQFLVNFFNLNEIFKLLMLKKSITTLILNLPVMKYYFQIKKEFKQNEKTKSNISEYGSSLNGNLINQKNDFDKYSLLSLLIKDCDLIIKLSNKYKIPQKESIIIFSQIIQRQMQKQIKNNKIILSNYNLKKNSIYLQNSLNGLTDLQAIEISHNESLCSPMIKSILRNSMESLKILNLSYNNIDDNIGIALFTSLLNCPNVLQLNLSNNNLSYKSINSQNTKKYFKNKKLKLQKLNLSNNLLGSNGAISLFDSLQNNNSLNMLNLSFNGIDTNVFNQSSVETFFSEHRYLFSFYYEGNYLPSNEVELLIKCLVTNTSINYLYLGNNQITDESLDYIGYLISHNANINSLDISYNNITNKGIDVLFEKIAWRTRLIELNLSNSNINVSSLKTISKVLKNNQNILCLDLSQNSFKDKQSGELIADLISGSNQIKNLNLNACHLGLSCKKIFEVLGKNKKIGVLNLSGNDIGNNTNIFEILKASLLTNKILKFLYLDKNHINDKDFALLSEGVKFNILLRVISLKMNKITLKNCLEIIANISKNDNIKEIYLDDNPIVSRSDLDMLNKALQGNGTRKKK